MLLNDSLVTSDQFRLVFGLLIIVVTLLLETSNLFLEMLGRLPEIGIGLLNSNGLLSFGEVFALRVIKVCLGL